VWLTTQALFLHDPLIVGALNMAERSELDAETRHLRATWRSDDLARGGALEGAVARLLGRVRELNVALVAGDLQAGELVTFTQDLYVRRDSDERGSFRCKLDSDRKIALSGRFSTSRLVGTTGRSETFGHNRVTVVGYVGDVALDVDTPRITVRPIFMGWRALVNQAGHEMSDDRREVWAGQIDQFSAIRGKRASAAERGIVSRMREDEVKHAFADIIGEPFVPSDWGGETSDLFSSRLSEDGEPLTAAFAFKGRAVPGPLYVAGMGKRGDQALRLAQEPADLLVVQHHNTIAAAVRNLLSAIARERGKRYTVIDGETTAVILREYDKLPDEV
jgi:hypothetical protein